MVMGNFTTVINGDVFIATKNGDFFIWTPSKYTLNKVQKNEQIMTGEFSGARHEHRRPLIQRYSI